MTFLLSQGESRQFKKKSNLSSADFLLWEVRIPLRNIEGPTFQGMSHHPLNLHPLVSSSTSNATGLLFLYSLCSLLPSAFQPISVEDLAKLPLFRDSFNIPFPTSSHRLTKERQALSGIPSPPIVWGAYNFYFSLNYHLFKGEKLAFLSMPHSEHYRLQTGGLNKHLLTARLTHVFNFLARRGQQTVEGTSSSCEGSRASKLAMY